MRGHQSGDRFATPEPVGGEILIIHHEIKQQVGHLRGGLEEPCGEAVRRDGDAQADAVRGESFARSRESAPSSMRHQGAGARRRRRPVSGPGSWRASVRPSRHGFDATFAGWQGVAVADGDWGDAQFLCGDPVLLQPVFGAKISRQARRWPGDIQSGKCVKQLGLAVPHQRIGPRDRLSRLALASCAVTAATTSRTAQPVFGRNILIVHHQIPTDPALAPPPSASGQPDLQMTAMRSGGAGGSLARSRLSAPSAIRRDRRCALQAATGFGALQGVPLKPEACQRVFEA